MKWTITALAILAGGLAAIWYFIIRPMRTPTQTPETAGVTETAPVTSHYIVGDIPANETQPYLGEGVTPLTAQKAIPTVSVNEIYPATQTQADAPISIGAGMTEAQKTTLATQLSNLIATSKPGTVSMPRPGDVWDPVSQSYVYPLETGQAAIDTERCNAWFAGLSQADRQLYFDNYAVFKSKFQSQAPYCRW